MVRRILLTLALCLPMLFLVSAFPCAAGVDSYETKTFGSGALVIPMDNHQAERLEAFGLAHALLRNGITVFRIIEPPDVTLNTTKHPGGDIYAGGPIMVEGPVPYEILEEFASVSVDTLVESFTSDRVFRADQATEVLVINGFLGHTQDVLEWMRIPCTVVETWDIAADPSMLEDYNLVVVDCIGWLGGIPEAVREGLQSIAAKGGEVVFTDVALIDLVSTFPGYVSLIRNEDGDWNFDVHNVGEFPSQFSGPTSLPIYTMDGGIIVDQVIDDSVRVILDSGAYGSQEGYRVGAFYFPYGEGIVEGFAYHPGDQTDERTRILCATLYGNKFIHTVIAAVAEPDPQPEPPLDPEPEPEPAPEPEQEPEPAPEPDDIGNDGDSNTGVDMTIETNVDIDIKPGSLPNSINLRNKGNVPVAVLSTQNFDATTVDRNTVVFAGATALETGGAPEDVNGDGLLDVVLHFKTSELNLASDSTEACLYGMTLSGQRFQGCDSVQIVGK